VAEEWILTNPNFTAHPFHIHIFPFQIMSVKSDLLTLYANDSTINTPAAQRIMEALTTDAYMQTPGGERWVQWRDTVVIPAYGEVRIRIRFDYEPGFNLNGKTVFHCHFLPHEDTGMITSWRMHEELRPFDPESEP
jgi:FtsP/CotA-like multicopper oxidase with cupredoxin domain